MFRIGITFCTLIVMWKQHQSICTQLAAKMNFANSQAKNYLFTSSENKDEIKEFLEIAAAFIKEKKVVLLFTRTHVDFTSVVAGLCKEQMQNFIISYHSDLNGIVEKLLELHDWTFLPDLVIFNLNSYFGVGDEKPSFKKVCFCIAALFSYMRSVEVRKSVNRNNAAQCIANSVSLLNAHRDMQIQLLIDFYFYKEAAFNELHEMRNKIVN